MLSAPQERVLALVLLLSMFAWSGGQKIRKLGNTQTKQFIEVFKFPESLAIALVFMAGIWEVGSVAAIAYGEYSSEKWFVLRGIEALMVFTVLATLIYKVYPKRKPIQIAANASVLGGLLLFHICSRSDSS